MSEEDKHDNQDDSILARVSYNYDSAQVVHFDGVRFTSAIRLGRRITKIALYDVDFGPGSEAVRKVQIDNEEYLQSELFEKDEVKRVRAVLVVDDEQLKEIARIACKVLDVVPPSELDAPPPYSRNRKPADS